MQTLTTSTGTYALAPTRNVGELQALFAKCTGKYKPSRISPGCRKYPHFHAGMSTSEYVAMYEQLNRGQLDRATYKSLGFPAVPGFFASLNDEPCTLYTGEDRHEVIDSEVIEFPQPELLAA